MSMYVQITQHKAQTSFYGYSPFKVLSFDEFINNDDPNAVDLLDDSYEEPMSKETSQAWKNQYEAIAQLEEAHRKENERIFREHIKPENLEITEKIIDSPSYNSQALPFLIDMKKSELEYLHGMINKKDSFGEMRIPSSTLPFFTNISEERLRMLEPLMLSKNDAGMWNYSPSFILSLDQNYNDKQIHIMSKLAECKLNGLKLRTIAENPNLNHQKTIEKAQELNVLYGKKLREIEFFSNRNGENWLSADIQLPHKEDKPDYLNFKRVFARLDNDVNPIKTKGPMKEIDIYIDNMYSNLEEKLDVFNEKDLNLAINKVSKSNPDASEEEILRTMQKLTQFASYSSLKTLEKTE